MKQAVWVVSVLLAVAAFFIGGTKLVTPAADLESMSAGVPVVLLRIAGIAEVVGALGLILPAATRILPTLTPIAATGLVLTWIGATITNIVIGDSASIPLALLLGAVAGFVAWARFGRYAIQPRDTADEGTAI